MIFEWSSMMHIMAKLLRPFSIMKICNMKSIRVTKPKIWTPKWMDHSKQPTRRTKNFLKNQPDFSRTCGFREEFTGRLNFQIPSSDSSSQHCFACARIFEASRDINLYECPDCSQIFCCDCDIFIHEALHSCPGCSSTPQLAAVNQTQPTAGTGVTNTNGNHHFNGILWE